MRYDTPARHPGTGVREEQLHQATGLRNASLTAAISSNLNGIFTIPNGSPIGPADGVADGIWYPLRAASATPWYSTLPIPMTPTVSFWVATTGTPFPQTVRAKIRMRGTDQFGNSITEETPWVSKVQTATSMAFLVNMSKVFATVDECWIQGSGYYGANLDIGQVSLGWHCVADPLLAQAAAVNVLTSMTAGWWATYGFLLNAAAGVTATNFDFVGTAQNWGIGTPMLQTPYGPNNPFPSPEILGATGILLREKSTPTVLNTVARLPARGQIAVAGAAPVTGVAIGRSVAGWQGTPHKIGFFSNDAWVTKIAGINLGGSSTRAGGIPTTQPTFAEDELQIIAMLRTTMGTQRGTNAKKIYVRG